MIKLLLILALASIYTFSILQSNKWLKKSCDSITGIWSYKKIFNVLVYMPILNTIFYIFTLFKSPYSINSICKNCNMPIKVNISRNLWVHDRKENRAYAFCLDSNGDYYKNDIKMIAKK